MDLRKEDILLQLRDQLKKDQVKLWLPPYTVNDESSENDQEDKAFRVKLSFSNRSKRTCYDIYLNEELETEKIKQK